MKVTPSTFAAAANSIMVVGLGMGTASAPTVTTGMPIDGIFFSNCSTYSTTAPTCPTSSPVWHGFVVAGSTLIGSVQTCTAAAETGNIVQGKTSYLRIEVRSVSDIHFYVDTDTSTGITETECGTGVTGTLTPVNGLTMWLQDNITTNTATTVAMNVDYFRVWQDDNIVPLADPATPPTSSDISTDTAPPLTVDSAPAGPDPKDTLANLMTQTDPDSIASAGRVDTGYLTSLGGVVTPQLTADSVVANTIKPVGVDINMELGADGRFVIKNPAGQEAMAIDSSGNATFAGTITADKIQANQIQGLEIYAGSIKTLSEQVAQLNNPGTQAIATSNSGSGNQSVLGATTGTGAPASNIIDLSNLNIQTATVALELNVGGMLYANGGLTINGLAQFNGQSVFNDLATFNGAVSFNTDVGFTGRATFNSDSGGFATIHNGQQQVKVVFDKPYAQVPAVTVNIKNGQFAQYAYKDLDQNGFTIILAQPATGDVEFAWTALSIKDARTAQAGP
jgi:hypothetical protein